MQRQERYSRVIRGAAERLGGEARLAALLGVPGARVRRWASGEEEPPLEAFLAGLDVIANGRHVHRFRVVVVDGRHRRAPPAH